MKFILALLFAIPTYGISIILLFAYMYYQTFSFKKKFEQSIIYLSKNKHTLGVCFEGINYVQAVAYANEIGTVSHKTGTYLEFYVEINNNKYKVMLDKETFGENVVLNVLDFSWIENIYTWLSKYDSDLEISNITTLKGIVLGSAANPERYLHISIEEIPSDLFRIESLEYLHLQNNCIKTLPNEIGNLINLKDLKLGGNELTTLPSTIGKLKNLEILTIWMNDLTTIPPEIGLLCNLKGLSLWSNPLTSLPEEIVNLTQLKKLEIGFLPNLQLSSKQKDWIESLKRNGCEVWED